MVVGVCLFVLTNLFKQPAGADTKLLDMIAPRKNVLSLYACLYPKNRGHCRRVAAFTLLMMVCVITGGSYLTSFLIPVSLSYISPIFAFTPGGGEGQWAQ